MKSANLTVRIAALMTLSLGQPSALLAGWTSTDAVNRAIIGTPAPAFRVIGLQSQAGKRLSVFYVNAREGTISISGNSLQISTVMKEPVTQVIPANGIVEIPATDVERSGFTAFNYVVIGIHSADQLFLRKGDGSFVRDRRLVDDAGSNVKEVETKFEDRLRHIFIGDLQRLAGSGAATLPWEPCSQAGGTRRALNGC